MSAKIPSTMPLSDLLKPTGYNCPSELQGKTFDEATSGSDTKISTNTAATVDVSTYTEPVEIEPAEDYDATKKVTLTLSNIPSADIEANKAALIDVSTYTEPVEITPTQGKDGMAKATVTLTNIPSGSSWHCWSSSDSTQLEDETYLYLSFATAPDTIPTNTPVASAIGQGFPVEHMTLAEFYERSGAGVELVSVTKVSDNELSVVISLDGVPADPYPLYRNSFLAGYDL